MQAWASVAVGGLLSFNLIFPTDEPSVARLMGMWSIWMFTVPSLRARDCSKNEKDALNLLFLVRANPRARCARTARGAPTPRLACGPALDCGGGSLAARDACFERTETPAEPACRSSRLRT